MTRSEIDAKLTKLAREMSSIPWDGVEITPALRALLKEQKRMLTAYRAACDPLPPIAEGLLDNVLSDQETTAVIMARMKGSPEGATTEELEAAVDWARLAAITRGLLHLVMTGQVVIVGMDGEDNPVFRAASAAS